MKMFKLPRNNKGLVFQGPQSSPKLHQNHLGFYRNHFGIFISPEKVFELSGQFIFIKTEPNFL